MKGITLLLSACLASAQLNIAGQFRTNPLNRVVNVGEKLNLSNLDLGILDLGSLNIGGLNLGRVDLRNQGVVAEAILALLGGFCLDDALDPDSILRLGLDNDVDLFFQLAQLMRFEQLGFLDLRGIHSLFNKGLVLGGFNLGHFKREVSEARKTMKRTRLHRGQVRRQCATLTATATDEVAFIIATADPNAVATSTTAVVEEKEEKAGFTTATAANPGSSTTSSASAPSASATTVSTTRVAAADASVGASSVTAANTSSVAAAATEPAAQVAAGAAPAVAQAVANAPPVAAAASGAPTAVAASLPINAI
ncbi:hypothetical protein VTK26DRAFT_7333 [Humicola hyalothermophila]